MNIHMMEHTDDVWTAFLLLFLFRMSIYRPNKTTFHPHDHPHGHLQHRSWIVPDSINNPRSSLTSTSMPAWAFGVSSSSFSSIPFHFHFDFHISSSS